MHLALLISTFSLLARPSVAASLLYCASENTGSSYSAVSNTYQSNGACIQTCANYAFGILQGYKCWCSNVAPAESDQTSFSECSVGCPGYPADSCGSAPNGVWAYVKVPGNDVISTAKGGDSTSTSTSTSFSTSTTTSSAISTSTSTSTTSTSTSTSSTSSSSTTSSPTTSPSETPTTDPTTDSTTTRSVVTETTGAGGEVKTVTVSEPVPTSNPIGAAASPAHTSSHLSGGSIAGIVVGVIGGLALVGALIFLVFFYRKRARAASPIPSQDMADRTSQGSSFVRGVFPQGHANDLAGSAALGRKQTFTDNRLKTDIYPNGPRDSSVSLQDNEDYSRPVLRLTNPD